MKGIILSGGRGTRLRPITHTGPKQLVPVANKPVIEYAIEDLRDVGITDIGVVLGNTGREEIQEHLGDGSRFGVDVSYIVQGNPLGVAHAIGCARDFVRDDDFVVYLGDNILKRGIRELVTSFRNGDYSGSIALNHVDDPQQFGVADVDEEGDVHRLVEKPEDPPSNLALIGVYVFSPSIFDAIDRLEPSWRGEFEITDAIQHLLDEDHAIDSHVVKGWWKDTGRPEDVLAANRLVLEEHPGAPEGTVHDDAETAGHLDLHVSATIEAGAVVRGPASIAENSVIKSDTYVGPFTSIGPDCTVKGANLENSIVVGDSTIRTDVKIVDSLLGRGTEIDSTKDELPAGRRLIVGENSRLKL